MVVARHRLTRTFADPLAVPTAHEAAMIEKELQQAQPGAATVQMAPQRQAVAQPRVCSYFLFPASSPSLSSRFIFARALKPVAVTAGVTSTRADLYVNCMMDDH